MRKDYLERLKTALSELEDGFNYNYWYPIDGEIETSRRWDAVRRYQTDPVAAKRECGTGACAGGWTVALFMEECGITSSEAVGGQVENIAQDMLDLTVGQARFLFHPYAGNRWINDVLQSRDNAENDIQDHIERQYTDRDLQQVELSEAIARIDHLLSGKKIELYFDKHSPLEEVWLRAASAIGEEPGNRFGIY